LHQLIAEVVDDRADGLDATEAFIEGGFWHFFTPPKLRGLPDKVCRLYNI